MKVEDLVQALGEEWEQPQGFLGQLRMRAFDHEAYSRFLRLLALVDFDNKSDIDRRIVTLLWFVPTFMMWQTESLVQVGIDETEYRNATEVVIGELYRILGVP